MPPPRVVGRGRRATGLLLSVAALYAAVFGLWSWRGGAGRAVRLAASSPQYFHYDIVELTLRTRDPELDAVFSAEPPRPGAGPPRPGAGPPRLVVTRGGETLTTIAGIREMTASSTAPGVWTARWPVPWNAPAGEYRPVLLGRPDLSRRLVVSPFKIARRKSRPMPQGFVVVTLESVTGLSSMRVKGPDGRDTDWRGLLDWAQWLGADAFWMLGGQSPGLAKGEVWVQTNLKLIPKVASECRKRGLKFGIYAMYSLTMSKEPLPGYEYGLDIVGGKSVPTRAISLGSGRRLDDVVAFLKPFAADPNVDYVGVDYIRDALGGYELVDDFIAEMPGLSTPSEWPRLTHEERMTWLARKKIMRRDASFVEAWQWWRARRAALLVKEIKARLGGKPLWAFTLTWDKGWHHGQDSVMMNDAGVDIDALMFYEADKPQYDEMLRDWHAYVRHGDVQLLPGNIFDWGLHQKDPAGPVEFGRRMKAAVNGAYGDGPARGVFFHDLSRLLWGNLGPWGTRGWADEAREVSRYVKGIARPATPPARGRR